MKKYIKHIIKSFLRYSGFVWIINTINELLIEIKNDQLRNHKNIHSTVILRGNITITNLEKILIGEHTVINNNTYIESGGGATIGRYVYIDRGLTIWSTNHNYHSTKSIPYDKHYILEPVKIDDFVLIQASVSIIPGITIGEGAIIEIGSNITKDVPKFAIMGGNPAKIIGYRDIETYQELKSAGKFH